MSGRIPKTFIDDLLARVDIVDLIDRYVPLKKAGANYQARCPFHSEKTPSFSVNRSKQFFHCFGCGASGNAIGFLMDYSHLDFVEAVEDLATFVGVEVPRETAGFQKSPQNKQAASDHYELLDQVANFYVKCLRASEGGKKAVNYLKSRGVTDEVAKTFQLGFAPDEWRALTGQFDQNLLLPSGMLVNKDDKTYDRFRNRIMFPIRDKRGRVVGFGGRVLDDSLPKYLNSPETDIFHKGKEVYGLYELLKSNSKPKRILVVEGYMDVIALSGHGIDYAVATLGTATSQTHLELLFRFTSELVFCFDGDNAGRQAAWRAMEPVFGTLKEGRQARVILLPPQHDPDSLVKAEGSEKFSVRVQESQPLSEFFFGVLSDGLNLNEMESRSQLQVKAKPYLDKLPDGAFKDMMVVRLRELTHTKRLDVSRNSTRLNKTVSDKSANERDIPTVPRRIIAALIQQPRLVNLLEQKEINLECIEFPGADVFKEILSMLLAQKPLNTAMILEHYRNQPLEKAIKELALVKLPTSEIQDDGEALNKEFSDAIDLLFTKGI